MPHLPWPLVFIAAAIQLVPGSAAAGGALTAREHALFVPGGIVAARTRPAMTPAVAAPDAKAPGAGDARWRELAPPQRSIARLLPDPARRRLVLAAVNDARTWDARWALVLDDPPRWEPIEDEATRDRPAASTTTVFDPHAGRWIMISEEPDARSPVRVHTLEPAEKPRWSRVDAGADSATPAGHWGASVVFDSRRDRVLLFGGFGYSDGWRGWDDVWSLDLGSAPRWRPIRPIGPGPEPRYFHLAAYDSVSDRMVVFGGAIRTSDEIEHATAEAWALELDGTPRWRRLEPGPESPPIAFAGTLHVDPITRELVVLGAEDTTRQTSGDWRLSLEPRLGWSPIAWASPPPASHARFAALYDPAADRFVGVIPGRSATDTLNLFSFGLRPEPTWEALGAGHLPPPRFGQASMLDATGDRAFVFGGVWSAFGSGIEPRYLNDVWWTSLAQPGRWMPIETAGEPPSPRHESAGIYDPLRRRLIVFGGWRYNADDSETYLDELWALELEGTPTWRNVVAEGGGPSGRRGHVAVLDPMRDRMIVFGGATGSGLPGETWALRLAAPMRWEIVADSASGPGGRWGASATLDAPRDRIVLQGGGGAGRSLGSTWEFSLRENRWSELLAANDGPSLVSHRAAWDAAGDRLIVIGGFAYDYDVIFSGWPPIVLDPEPEPRWSFLRAGGPPHESLDAATALYDPRRDRILCFGGAAFLEAPSNATWLLELGEGRERHAWLVAATLSEQGADVTWEGAGGAGVTGVVERRGLAGVWAPFATLRSDERGRWRLFDPSARPGGGYSYRLTLAGDEPEGEVTLSVPAAEAELLGALPNPSHGRLSLGFRLASPQPVTIELFDVTGRMLWRDVFTFAAAQAHVLRVDAPLRPGVYLARLRTPTHSLTRRIAVLP